MNKEKNVLIKMSRAARNECMETNFPQWFLPDLGYFGESYDLIN